MLKLHLLFLSRIHRIPVASVWSVSSAFCEGRKRLYRRWFVLRVLQWFQGRWSQETYLYRYASCVQIGLCLILRKSSPKTHEKGCDFQTNSRISPVWSSLIAHPFSWTPIAVAKRQSMFVDRQSAKAYYLFYQILIESSRKKIAKMPKWCRFQFTPHALCSPF